MKICLINNVYKPHFRGGAGTITSLLAEELARQGHAVTVISTKSYSAPKLDNRAGNIESLYLNSLFMDLGRIPLVIRLFWHWVDMFDFLLLRKYKKIFQSRNFDLVITNNLKGMSFLLPGLIKKIDVKHIHILHDIQLIHPSGLVFFGKESILDGWAARFYQKMCARLFSSVKNVVSPSAWLLDMHVKKGFFTDANKKVIPNPVEKISANKAAPNSNLKDDYIFFTAGQNEPHKGVFLLINSFIKARAKEPEKTKRSKLYIIGRGSQTEEARKLAAGHLEIEFYDKLTHAELMERMPGYDCAVVPSLCYENSPTVIYEAAGFGLDVLAADLGGIPELTKKFGGTLFKPGDEADLAEKIVAMGCNSTKSLKPAGVDLGDFSIGSYAKRLID